MQTRKFSRLACMRAHASVNPWESRRMLLKGGKEFFAICVAVLYHAEQFDICGPEHCICVEGGKRWHL